MNESLYREVHKGMRVMLCDLLTAAGRADFTDAAELASLSERTRETFSLLESHAAHENEFLAPLYGTSEVGSLLASAHDDQEQAMARLLQMLRAIDASSDTAAAEGHQFAVALSRFVSEQLVHMADEEEIGEPSLQKTYGPAKLHDVHQALVGSVQPEELAKFLGWMLPAITHGERLAMLRGMQAGAPPEVFGFVRGIAAASLSPEDDARLTRDLLVAA